LPPGGTSVRPASEILATVRKMGLKVVLVSGRAYAQLGSFAEELRAVDALVAENGAVIEAPVGGAVRVIGRKTGEEVRRRLATARGMEAEYGEIVVSVPRRMGPRVDRLLKDLAVDLIPNVDRVMVLPKGVTKASGMRIALRALHLSSQGFAAVGDGENDIDLLHEAELSGAVANANPRVRSIADYACRASFVAGVEEFVKGPLADYLAGRSPTRNFASRGPHRPLAISAGRLGSRRGTGLRPQRVDPEPPVRRTRG
jgi:predicted mannosyl-3-phosphoglycerate phosphatase (HAD superfamily)